MKKRLILSLLFLCFNFCGFAQSHYLLSRIEAFKYEKRVVINWTIRRGGSCFGIGIFRSTDKVNYETIGEITGNCGSSESEQSYTFTDENPIINKINYYVLEMGFSGKTDPPLAIEYFEFAKNKSLVIPNPMRVNATIHFINPDLSLNKLHIYDASGKLLKILSTNSENFILSSDDVATDHPAEKNKYYYTITDEYGKRVSSGLFIGILP